MQPLVQMVLFSRQDKLLVSKPVCLPFCLSGSSPTRSYTELCSGFAPNEKEIIVLIGLRVNPTLCPLGKSANAQGSSCPLITTQPPPFELLTTGAKRKKKKRS